MSKALANVSWTQALAVYWQKPVLIMLFLGFSAGLPYLLVFSTLSAWLRDYDVSRSMIGFFSWVGMTYSIKVMWAPVIDAVKLPVLARVFGHRRSWLLLAQCGIALALIAMVSVNPSEQLTWVAIAAVVVAFCSATQDVVIDAFRIEIAAEELQGALSSSYYLGYRLALLVAGAGALFVADAYSWKVAYYLMAALMGVGVMTVLLSAEPVRRGQNHTNTGNLLLSGAWFLDMFWAPIADFFKRNGRFALVLLVFVGVYRLSDIVMGIMANPFYLDLGFSKTEIASVSKIFGFFMTILGSFLGGLFVVKYGVYRPLLIGAVGVAVTNLLFALLANIGADINWLALTITSDNLFGGFAGAAFIAYLSSLTNRAYTATQYALFSSFMTLPGKLISGFSGVVVDTTGYSTFFIYAAVLGLPAIVMSAYLLIRRVE